MQSIIDNIKNSSLSFEECDQIIAAVNEKKSEKKVNESDAEILFFDPQKSNIDALYNIRSTVITVPIWLSRYGREYSNCKECFTISEDWINIIEERLDGLSFCIDIEDMEYPIDDTVKVLSEWSLSESLYAPFVNHGTTNRFRLYLKNKPANTGNGLYYFKLDDDQPICQLRKDESGEYRAYDKYDDVIDLWHNGKILTNITEEVLQANFIKIKDE